MLGILMAGEISDDARCWCPNEAPMQTPTIHYLSADVFTGSEAG